MQDSDMSDCFFGSIIYSRNMNLSPAHFICMDTATFCSPQPSDPASSRVHGEKCVVGGGISKKLAKAQIPRRSQRFGSFCFPILMYSLYDSDAVNAEILHLNVNCSHCMMVTVIPRGITSQHRLQDYV